ncbi:MAG TPA: putative baseplate assembly protein, partial [Capsulimonadaceae bacterium]|nr:putative baseplate assembly protein [Capsulimonadaceae bacterium]
YGFNNPPNLAKPGGPTGLIELALPAGLVSRQVQGRRAYWVRCVYATDLPPRGPEQLRPSLYQKPPEFRSILARTIGGTASSSNAALIARRDLGQSDGTPGQVFRLGHAPVLPRRPGETLLIGEQGLPIDQMQEWTEVEDFAESSAEDRHYVCDSMTGEIFLGPSVPQPDGSARQHGAVPAKGLTVMFSAYRYGGGTRGNVSANQVNVLKSSIPYIANVYNPRRAEGGREQENIERAKMRGRSILRQRDRAVTAEDYEYLACRASTGVGRARCIQPRALHGSPNGYTPIPPGLVRVLLVPLIGDETGIPRAADLRVSDRVRQEVERFLDERRLLTAVLEVGAPDYVFVSTEITLVAEPKADADIVRRAVHDRLARYINPLTGGPARAGWPFGLNLTLSDIYAQVQAGSGVAFLLDARIYTSRVDNLDEGLLGPEERVSTQEGVRIGPNELLCTREHRIRVRPMSAVGTEENE